MKKLITKTRLTLVLVTFFCLSISYSRAQVQITSGQTITENFNSLSNNALATLPSGWKADKQALARTVGTYAGAVTATERKAGNNMSNTASNGIYNYAAGDVDLATDRAVGFISSNSATKSGNLYVMLQNNGTLGINDFKVSFDVEKYRNGTNPAGFTVKMYYSTDGTAWVDAGVNFTKTFAGPDTANNGFASAPAATLSVTAQDLSITVAPGSNLYLAFNYSVTSGTTTSSAQALGIDNVSIQAVGNSGIFQEYVLTNTGSDILDSGVTFNGKNFGNININGTFILKGGKIKTWKIDPPDNITGARMFYRVYLQSATPPTFTTVNLPWSADLPNLHDQLWAKDTLAHNILNGLALGDYYLEVYYEADYTSGGTPAIHTDNNNGTNYKASFSVVPPPAQSGIFERYIVTSTGTDTYTEGALFNNSNLGSFQATGLFILKGGQAKTWKNVPPDNITASRMFYRIYLQTATPPAFTSLNLPWFQDLPNLHDQLWQNIGANVFILNGLTPGNYYLEVYFEADYTSGGTSGIHVDNNSGSNYKATFKLLCPTTSIPFAEGFNATTIPGCWSEIQEGGSTLDWSYVASSTFPTAPYEGSDFAILKSTSTADNKVKLVSPVINLTGAIIPCLSFRHFMHIQSTNQDELRVYYRTSSSTAWVLLKTYTSDVTAWTERKITLPNVSATYQVAFEGNAKFGYGIAIDNVKIEQPPAKDMAMVDWISPKSGCSLTATEHITVRIANVGSQSQQSIPVVASIDGGVTLIGPEFLPGTMAPGDTLTYTFTHAVNMATPGVYNSGVLVHLTGDANVHNDTVVSVINSLPLIATFPYTQNFDFYSGWTPGIISGPQQWELGLPAKTQLNTDYSGMNSKSWITKLAANYDNNANVTLTSPCLNFTSLSLPMFSVYLNIKTQADYDAMILESSVDGGTTWSKETGDAGFYNNTGSLGGIAPPKWSGTNGGWTKYETSLPDLAGEPNVKIRFRFQSDNSITNEGIAIDLIHIYDPISKDVGASAVISPVNSMCGSATDTLKIVATNYGYLAQSTIPVKIKVVKPDNTILNFTDTLLSSLTFNQKDTLIAHTINTLLPGTYAVTAYSALTGDLDHTNDTIHYSFVVSPPLTIPYVQNFETTVPGWQYDMTIGTGHGNTSKVIYKNLNSGNTTAYAESPKAGPIVTGDFLMFDYRIVDFGSPWPASTIGAGDTIKILVSSDCGATFNILDTIYDAKHVTSNLMVTKHYILNAYNGDDIIVKFDIQRQTAGNYYVDIDNFIIGNLPVVHLGNDTTICSNASITLNAGNVSPYTTYSWGSIPPGFTSAIRNPTVSPTVSTEYFVVVNNGFGSTATDSIVVGVKPAPVFSLGANLLMCHASSTTIDAGLEMATIDNQGLRGVLPTGWTMNDAGGLVIEQSGAGGFLLLDNSGDWVVSKAYNLTGLLNVKLKVDIASYGAGTNNLMTIEVSNDNGATWNAQFPFVTDTTQTSSYITQGPFTVTATGSQVKFRFKRPSATGKGIRFRDFKLTSAAPYASYTWSTSVHTQSINVSNAGNYWCEVVASNGCSARDTIGVSFYTAVPIHFGTDTAICAGSSLLLDPGASFTSYQWNGNPILTQQTFTVTAAGTFWVVAHDAHSCISSDTISVIISPLPIVNLGPNKSICPGTKDTLNAGAGINYSYTWKKIGSSTVIGSAQKLIVTTAGTYYVVVNNGCAVTATDSVTITLLPATNVNLGLDMNICPQTPTQLDAGVHTSYLWNTGASTQHITVTLPGIYSVTVTDATTCKDADSITIGSYTAPTVNLGHDTTICIYNSILLNAGIGSTTYSWFNGSTGQTLLIQGSLFGLGVVHASVTVTNIHGCIATDTVKVTIDPCTGIDETASNGINIYPNPSNGFLFVEFTGSFSNNCDVFVYNIQGQLVKSQNVTKITNHSVFELDMNKQSKGVYFVKIINGDNVTVNKIVLN